MDPIAPAFDPSALASHGAGRGSSSSAFTWSVLSSSYFGGLCNLSHWTSISRSSVRPSETLVSPHVLWPLTPAVSLGGMGNCADDRAATLYLSLSHVYLWILLIQSEPAVSSAISLFLYSPLFYLNLLAFHRVSLISPFYSNPTLSLRPCHLAHPSADHLLYIIDSLPLLSPIIPARGGYIKVTDLPSNWTPPRRGVRLGWLCETFLINERPDGHCPVKLTSFRLSLRHVRWEWIVCPCVFYW